ncbi:hypothetical protein C4546_03985 [Candidatus Parcubacteria bacterium]|jgi:hypothetical protein|nr:MAG: hypothetical protein C4546_03985 [Candidatus Parcubacteria bacterium]
MRKLKSILLASCLSLGLIILPINQAFAAEGPVLTGLSLSPGQLSLVSGQTAVFTLTALYNDGTSADVTQKARFELPGGGFTGIPGQRGEFVAIAQGTWVLTGLYQGLSATASISITHGPISKLNILPVQASLPTDGFLPIRVYALDSNGNSWDVTKESVFSTTDPSGQVTAEGYQPHSVGNWQVSASFQGQTAGFPVTVTPGSVKNLEITPGEKVNLDIGDQFNFNAKATDAAGNQITTNVSWQTTNPKVAKVSKDGKLKALKPGQTNLIAEVSGERTIVSIIVNGAEPSATETTDEIVSVQKPKTIARAPRVSAEEIEKVPVTENFENSNSLQSTAPVENCKNIAHPWTIIILLLQIIALAAYFTWLIKKPFKLWWVAPGVLTLGLLLIYSQLFCNNTYLWWPWTVLGISVIFISVYYQRVELKDSGPPDQKPV